MISPKSMGGRMGGQYKERLKTNGKGYSQETFMEQIKQILRLKLITFVEQKLKAEMQEFKQDNP